MSKMKFKMNITETCRPAFDKPWNNFSEWIKHIVPVSYRRCQDTLLRGMVVRRGGRTHGGRDRVGRTPPSRDTLPRDRSWCTCASRSWNLSRTVSRKRFLPPGKQRSFSPRVRHSTKYSLGFQLFYYYNTLTDELKTIKTYNIELHRTFYYFRITA